MRKILDNTSYTWKLLIILMFWSSVSLGQLVRVQIHDVPLYPHDFITVILCLYWLWSLSTTQLNVLKWLKTNSILVALIGWILFGWLHALVLGELGTTAVVTALRLVAYSIAAIQAISLFTNYFSSWYRTSIVFFTTFLMTCWGILQYLLIPDTRFLHILGWDDHYYRLIGPLLDPNFAGLITVIALWSWRSVSQDVLSKCTSRPMKQILNLLVPGISIMALAMTFSRSSWLAFGGGIIVSLIFTSSKLRVDQLRRGLLWIVVLVVCYWMLPKPTGEGVDITRTTSVTARSSLTQQLIASWGWQEWLIGKGLFNVRPNIDSLAIAELEGIPNTSRQPDNLVVQLIGSIGLGGTILLMLFLRKVRATTWLSAQNISLLAAWFIHAQFNNSLFQPQLWILFVTYITLHHHETKQQKLVAELNS